MLSESQRKLSLEVNSKIGELQSQVATNRDSNSRIDFAITKMKEVITSIVSPLNIMNSVLQLQQTKQGETESPIFR